MSQQPDKHNRPEKFHTLLIDGNGLFKLSIEGAKDSYNTKGNHIGGIYQFMIQLRNLLNKRDWQYVYCFFDGVFSGRLRYELLDEYKANRDKVYSEYGLELKQYVSNRMGRLKPEERNKAEEFSRQMKRLQLYLPELFIRQITDDIVEADDFISYYVNHKQENEVITIVTGDRDLFQHIGDGVFVYDLSFNKRCLITQQNFKQEYGYLHENIKVQKILIGDSSDNIKGVKQLGKDTLFKHFPEFLERKVELSEVIEKTKILQQERLDSNQKPLKVFDNIINQVTDGSQGNRLYEINDKLIDLKKPMLTEPAIEEIDAYMYAPLDPEGRSFENLYKLMIEDDIYGLFSDNKFVDFFVPFKRYVNTEVLRFKNSL